MERRVRGNSHARCGPGEKMEIISKSYLLVSHACAYSFVAYRTAYLKCHYPAEYFSALMTGMMDNTDKIAHYTAECKKAGIKVLPPSVNESFGGFTPKNGSIRFGLSAIKFLSGALIERLIKEREQNGEYTSLYDFCIRNFSRELGRKALEGLTNAGALDCLEPNRRQTLYNIDGLLASVEAHHRFTSQGQLNLFGDEEQIAEFVPHPMPEMEQDAKLNLEKEATGLYLSGHPLDKYSSLLSRMSLTYTTDILSGRVTDGKRVTLAGVVGELKVRQLKNNSILATARLEDLQSAITVTVFSKAYEQYRPLLTAGNPVILVGKVSEREDRDPEVICERVEAMPEVPLSQKLKPNIKSGLYLKVSSAESEEFGKVKEVLNHFRGNNPVFIVCRNTNRRLAAPKSMFVSENVGLISALKEILGEENVKFVK